MKRHFLALLVAVVAGLATIPSANASHPARGHCSAGYAGQWAAAYPCWAAIAFAGGYFGGGE